MILPKLISCIVNTDALEDLTEDLNENTKKFNSMVNKEVPPTKLEVESALEDLSKISEAANRTFNEKTFRAR